MEYEDKWFLASGPLTDLQKYVEGKEAKGWEAHQIRKYSESDLIHVTVRRGVKDNE
jgi:hypothetical protein